MVFEHKTGFLNKESSSADSSQIRPLCKSYGIKDGHQQARFPFQPGLLPANSLFTGSFAVDDDYLCLYRQLLNYYFCLREDAIQAFSQGFHSPHTNHLFSWPPGWQLYFESDLRFLYTPDQASYLSQNDANMIFRKSNRFDVIGGEAS